MSYCWGFPHAVPGGEKAEEPVLKEESQEQEKEEAGGQEEEATAADTSNPVKIGVLTWYTGTRADLGTYICDAADLAVKEINEAGGVLGGRAVEIVYEDMGADQQTTINGAQKMVNTEGISCILGPFTSTFDLAISDVIKTSQIPTLAMGSATTLLELDNPYYHLPRMTDEQVGAMAAQYVVETLGMTKPAVIYMNNDSGVSFKDVFVTTLKDKYGYEPAIEIGYDNETEKNYAPYAAQIMNSEADGVVATGNQSDAGLVMRALYDAGCDLPKYARNSAYVSSVALEIAGEAANGWYATADWSTLPLEEQGKAFEAAYEAYAGREANLNAACTYDAIYLLVDAIERAGNDDTEAINEAMKAMDYQGVVTHYVADGKNSWAQYLLLVQTQDVQPVVVGRVDRVK